MLRQPADRGALGTPPARQAELESIRPPLPGGHRSPDQPAPYAPAEMGAPAGQPYSLLVWEWDGQTDRQR